MRAARRPLVDWVVAVLVLALLAWGWRTRADPALGPHGWPGYLLGLGGALMMLAVLGFSWVKRRPAGERSVGIWYHAHVLFGVFGPLAVMIHARFGWGSLNSGFALATMLVVVASGLIARYALGPLRRGDAGAWVEAWHYLHVPLSMVLLLAVIVHVYMAHAY